MVKDVKLFSGLVVGDVDWLAQMLVPDGMGPEGMSEQGQRIIELLRAHESDFRLDANARELKLKAEWTAWEREAHRRCCVVCSEVMWTQDMSGREHVICIGCGRPLCLTHYLVHKKMEEPRRPVATAQRVFLPPDQHMAVLREKWQREHGQPMPEFLTLTQRAELATRLDLVLARGGEQSYTLFPDEYAAHWNHRCRTPIPPKNLRVLRAEQAALIAALVDIDKEMETAPPDPED